jgi:predicted AAA+ superfamily ATPase
MRSAYKKQIISDLNKKMIFLSGPRQSGKTHLAKSLMSEFTSPVYLNYDHFEDREIIHKMSWPKKTDFLILDEIHESSCVASSPQNRLSNIIQKSG